MHFWRGFFVYAAVSIAPPLFLAVLSLTIGAIAMLFAYVIAPVLVYAYPAMLFAPMGSGATPWLTLIIALVCCAVFGFLTRARDTGDQWILAIAAFAGWWILWRLISFFAGIHPHLDVRM